MKERIAEEFQGALRRLVSMDCWAVAAGGNVGSMFMLELGPKLRRQRPVPNSALPQIQREFKGELNLRVSCASWRLDSASEVVTACTDSNAPNGPMVAGLERLIGTVVTEAAAAPPGYDLKMVFDDEYTLSVLCDDLEEKGENYVLAVGSRYYAVDGRSALSVWDRSDEST